MILIFNSYNTDVITQMNIEKDIVNIGNKCRDIGVSQ